MEEGESETGGRISEWLRLCVLLRGQTRWSCIGKRGLKGDVSKVCHPQCTETMARAC